MKYSCDVVRDLMPLYHDEVVSADSMKVVEEHMEECEECQQYYKELCEADGIERFVYDKENEMEKSKQIKAVKKKMKAKEALALLVGILITGITALFIGGAAFGLGSFMYSQANIEVNTDITKYNQYIGVNAQEEYKNKWDMDETIFPKKITDDMSVEDYKMVYYNPWDAQYLSYLVVDYDDKTYKEEVKRLKDYQSTEYLGYYGAKGFDEEYTLLAMYADSYQGFVYALTDNKDTIIYVEIIFCNYFMDIDYKKYIDSKYLPLGFDATSDNAYEKKMRQENSDEWD